MMHNLAKMFGDQIYQVKETTIRKLMNYQMRSGTFVRTHMLEVIRLFNDIEIMRTEIIQ